MDCTYIIKTKLDITQAMLDVCVENSVDNLRTSIDGLLAVLKWEGENPPMFSGDTKYDHTEIRVVMATSEWTQVDP